MIKTFQTFNFRNLSNLPIELNSDFCLIIGENGSGKTSALEALYTLANGKSFRSSKTSSIVNINSDLNEFVIRGECVVRGDVTNIGLKKGVDEKFIAKIEGERVSGISELARLLPTQIVEPKSFHFFGLGASSRRRFFDWGLFHVEHTYASSWKQYINCLKQRNSLLRSGKLDRTLFDVWDGLLIQAAERIQESRSQYFSVFSPLLKKYLKRCLDTDIVESMDVRYYSGWDTTIGFDQALLQSWDKDVLRRSTQVGPHRSDLKFGLKGLPVEQALSRGQQKLTILCCHLAAINLVNELADQSAVLLLDDISSELDESNLALILGELSNLNTQVVISGIDKKLFDRVLDQLELADRVSMFHVEHGEFTRLN